MISSGPHAPTRMTPTPETIWHPAAALGKQPFWPAERRDATTSWMGRARAASIAPTSEKLTRNRMRSGRCTTRSDISQKTPTWPSDRAQA
eukprot:4646377-Prymnesium_polylepis.5